MENNQLNQQDAPQPQPYADYVEDEIDLRELFWILWAEKWLIIGVTALFAIGSVIYALMQPDIYRAEAVLAPADNDQSMGGLSAQFGGAAALLGVNVGGSGGDNISTAIATLKSRQFIGRFIQSNNLLVPLFAGSWDKSTGVGVINEEAYDASSGIWLSAGGPPSQQNAYRAFTNILSIGGPDRTTGIVTIAINWHNPIEAAEWVNKLVAAINADIRTQDVDEANRAIAYLRGQLEQTQLVDMQRVFYQLIESQTRITMLADVRDEYVFRVIDPATIPDVKVEPRRSNIAIVGTMVGGLFALAIVYLRRKLKPMLENSRQQKQ
ncbi:MAG: Wzz/FepE/Etk N-terminal domain-containing protein [Gammaproteobacteria bacterium]|nr:Wzz/FepE/Etk N-terminal domain-containing protein [Gammaproteobacteria bacterium]